MKRLGGLLAGMAAMALLAGCASQTIYSWGSYENQVYLMYAKPDKATAELQVAQMDEDFEKARSKNKPVPPGFHAHLGYLCYQLGKGDRARQEFEAEKAAFPESTVFVDRMLANMQNK